MNCELWQDKIDAYVDAELSPPEAAAMHAHLLGCRVCSAEALTVAQLKRATRDAGRCFAGPPELRTRLRHQIRPRRRWALLLVPSLATAAALLLMLAPIAFLGRGDQAGTELADLHVAALAGTSPVDVVSSDRHTVKPWFQGRVPFAFDLPVVDGTPFTLLGGRMAYLRQSPAAHLVYQYGRHRISVFILRDTSAPALAGTSFRMRTWTRDGLRYVAVTDAAPEILGQLERVFLAP